MLRTAALLALMTVILAATASYAAGPSRLPALGDNWLEFLRTLAGAFMGAAAAFAGNLYLQHRKERRENLAAGNLALVILGRQLVDTLILAKGCEALQATNLKKDAKAPVWAQMHPNHFHFSDALRFDLAPLSFLFETGHGDVLNKLAHAEQLYFDLNSMVQVHAETADQVQRRISENGWENEEWDKMEKLIGLALIAKTNTLTAGIFERLRRNPDDYRATIAELRDALQHGFPGEKIVRVDVDPKVERLTGSQGS